MDQAYKLNVDLRQMILAIETTVSLVGMNDTNHGKRVGYIASEIGAELDFSEPDIQFAFELGMLHDCGVSTEQMHSNLVNHFDWDGADTHCKIGYRLLHMFEPLSKFAIPILYHHTPWEELQTLDISNYDKRMANLTFLADRIDVLAASHYGTDILLARADIVDAVVRCSGRYFNPEFISAFLDIESSEAFWISLEDRHIARYTWDMGSVPGNQMLSLEQIKHLSLILAYIVDQKSHFTTQHSVRVADLAKYISSIFGLPEERCDKIEIAGLLHDLGKLHVPDDILEKKGPLDKEERSVMNRHSYETYEILRHIDGLEDIARWASYHHEGLNGIGYPFHPEKRDLSIEARIISVADVFQALVQDRPYRKGMSLKQVTDILTEMSESEKLDKEIVSRVINAGESCYAVAMGSDPNKNQEYMRSISS
ncbi:HD-GYP domain-containing protein [Vibrio salinus]|uniref:HD-GYP domain-containing protein n=1 Tax=Vibrio salinus TaxID=2899784 RepID=UPI001E302C9D|nr:HD domain-containing phosphohydrolase [Vibrio salinus]MCE0494811.1 HD domain-containing protein [Vibrio salinus]